MLSHDMRSFGRYCARFAHRFAADGFSWGRNNVLWGFVGGFVVFLVQLWTGKIQPTQQNAQIHDLIAPYLYAFFVWGAWQMATTAWKLDEERQAAIGLPLDITAGFDNDGLLTLTLDNQGPTDVFAAQVHYVSNNPSHARALPASVRWRGTGEAEHKIVKWQKGYIELLRVDRKGKQDDHGIPVQLFTRENELFVYGGFPSALKVKVFIHSTTTNVTTFLHLSVHITPWDDGLWPEVYRSLSHT